MLIHPYTLPACRSTKELNDRVKNINILASVIRRKSYDLNEKLQTCNIEYNPKRDKPIGRLTKDLNEICDLCYSLHSLADDI